MSFTEGVNVTESANKLSFLTILYVRPEEIRMLLEKRCKYETLVAYEPDVREDATKKPSWSHKVLIRGVGG